MLTSSHEASRISNEVYNPVFDKAPMDLWQITHFLTKVETYLSNLG
jgi:hypothetical protein